MKKLIIILIVFSQCTPIENEVLFCNCTEIIYSLDREATQTKLDSCYNEFEIQDFNYLDGRIKRIKCN